MVDAVNEYPGGRVFARFTGLLCLGLLLVSGCGTVVPNESTSGSSGSSSASQSIVLGGAQLGLVWSVADSTLRPIIGVPGATQTGAPLFPAGSYVTAAFSAQTQTALLVDPKGNLQSLVLPSTSPQTVVQGIPAGASIAFSPKGAYAVVFASGGTSVLMLSGLPQAPSANSVQAGAPVVAAAISDAGTLLVAARTGNNSVSVTASPASGSRSTLATLAGYGGMAFLPGSEDILLSDSVANTLARYHNGSATVLATRANGLNQPFAVAASLDDRWAVTANRADTNLLRIDLSGVVPPAQSTCACSPTHLSALLGNAVFELAAPGTAPGWMIEADDPVARVLFIPPARTGQ
ncbi:MAG TPA: hypothetical protein VMD92_02830 [Acidobacteriaceae bacterium]|jgi:hypothetical protein|nr:hypothetical protein [Acidobacteriaceae bacterium]